MSRALTWINLLGVLLLAILCALQWRTNRALNLQVNSLEATRLAQTSSIGDLSAKLLGLQADLDRFRDQLSSTTLSQKDSDAKLRASEHLATRLAGERDQLKAAIAQWTAAVAARDDRLAEANTRITDLAAQLNDTVVRYNALVADHNQLVKQLNDEHASAAAAGAQQPAPPAAATAP